MRSGKSRRFGLIVSAVVMAATAFCGLYFATRGGQSRLHYGPADDAPELPEESLPDDVLLDMSEGHMATTFNYRLTVRKNGVAKMETSFGPTALPALSASRLAEIVAACRRRDLARMRRSYRRPVYTDGGYFRLTLNDPDLRKSLLAIGGDPEAGQALALIDDLRTLLDIDRTLDALVAAERAAHSRREAGR